jgi:DNA (cytosine-5)-methyltransferase 1
LGTLASGRAEEEAQKMKPRLLDLFCGAGGASMGYHRAGFEVVGVDIKPQPHYPFEFHLGDALEYPLDGFDVIHASPPCQAYSSLKNLPKQAHLQRADLLGEVRIRLMASGVPYVIENVPGAPMRADLIMCGCMFGLSVRRQRWFEIWPAMFAMTLSHRHDYNPIAVYGDHPEKSKRKPGGGGYINRAHTLEQAQEAMGIDWMTWREITQAIPPSYTECIGEHLLTALVKQLLTAMVSS